ncbi:cytochrome c [soil metagenome]
MRILIPVAVAVATIAIAATAQTTHDPVVAGASSTGLSLAQTFTENCAACHQEDGKGIVGAFPALAGDKFVLGSAAGPIGVVLNGRAGMPTFKADLTDEQIAAALTHVRTSWGNKASPVTTVEVSALRTGTEPKPSDKKPMDAH